MQAGALSVESILTAYHDEYRRAFRESDSGRRFEDAFQVIVTDEGRREIDDAVRDIARNPYLDGEPSVLLNQVRSELKRIYEGIEDVRRQIRTSDEAVSRLVRQQTDTSYRTMLVKLNQLFAKTSAEAKANPNDPSRPYHTGAGQAQFQALPSRPAKSMARAISSSLNDAPTATVEAPDLKNMVEICGPRLTRMIRLIRRNPATTSDGMFVDLAESFNQLPKAERRESELVGFLSALRTQDDSSYVTWHCVSIDGSERVCSTKPIHHHRSNARRHHRGRISMTDDIETSIEEETPTGNEPSFEGSDSPAGHARAVQRRYRRHAHRGAHGAIAHQTRTLHRWKPVSTMPASTARLWNVRSTTTCSDWSTIRNITSCTRRRSPIRKQASVR